MPDGDKGRIGLAIARSNPQVLSALIQHASESGTYRSVDAGETWTKVNDQNGRPMYYSEIFIDPSNENRASISARPRDGRRKLSYQYRAYPA